MSKLCPLLKKACIEHSCRWYVQLIGANPQTGTPLAEFDCAINWLLIATLEGNKETRQAGGEINAFRNEMVMANVRAFDVMTRLPPPADKGPALGYEGEHSHV